MGNYPLAELYHFDAKQNVELLVNWIKDYFEASPKAKAVIGISGGKDSTIAAALCVKALGADRVVGVRMPQDIQHDIDIARDVCEYLGIESYEINIGPTYRQLTSGFPYELIGKNGNDIYKNNTPARIRMTTLYGVAALVGGRVVETCNFSENYVGYSTKFGDAAGDFSPLGGCTATEVVKMGLAMGLPESFVLKIPEDGLSGLTDEDNLGFSYQELDEYIRKRISPEPDVLRKIDELHTKSRHKDCLTIPCFDPVIYH